MKYKVIVTDTAKKDIREISYWIARQSKDPNTAKNFASELYDKCKKLESFPNGGALPKDRVLLSFGFRFISHKEYLIFYYTNDDEKTVYILAIINSKKDYMNAMKKYL